MRTDIGSTRGGTAAVLLAAASGLTMAVSLPLGTGWIASVLQLAGVAMALAAAQRYYIWRRASGSRGTPPPLDERDDSTGIVSS